MLKQRGSEEAQKQRAEQIAAQALGFIAGDPDRLANFFALTGLAPDEIRSAVTQPGFLASVLQHVLSDEDTASAFAAENDLTPEDLQRAAARLGLHWD
ncbi:hypothetical protein GCM10007874_19960 [Labrys miyagiensis]|uniref:DUF3572 family protein n=1 Tax=Labrys miyagiensis TaxID=346912 RepID=A0ABQ6CGT3_9HYPH|nr:DUF3572 domain-containing protein [Labrys miyagiensis]GLS18979.1 hypothetical protein GCM10007874_19960 [Labrys miyagiensis]